MTARGTMRHRIRRPIAAIIARNATAKRLRAQAVDHAADLHDRLDRLDAVFAAVR